MKTLKQILLGGVRKDETRRVEEPTEKGSSDVICCYDTMTEEEKREEREWIWGHTGFSEQEKMVKDCVDTNNTERYERHVGSVCPECGCLQL